MVTLLTLFALYFLPSIIAHLRGHHSQTGILVLNALFGWTILGWFAAFFWSLTWPGPRPVVIVQQAPYRYY